MRKKIIPIFLQTEGIQSPQSSLKASCPVPKGGKVKRLAVDQHGRFVAFVEVYDPLPNQPAENRYWEIAPLNVPVVNGEFKQILTHGEAVFCVFSIPPPKVKTPQGLRRG